ncbi:MAG TPA: hypothetical protein PKY77_06155 [Phycisphaerae bacterium]|nr:hypothetical protein [Phycisphaerae bacterium]HRY67896.1 hypothetical protein [Phycisphaerae bacterium]HSA26055.1 hypothetical protein [Phycisphaerae bacterium]
MMLRPTQPDDLPELAAFLQANGVACTISTLGWKYPGLTGGSGSPVRSWIAQVEGRIVGHIGVVPAVIRDGRRSASPAPAGWFMDWMVRDDLRARGIGVFLLREAAKHHPVLMTIQGSADTQRVLPQLGWFACDDLSLYKLNLAAGAISVNASLPQRTAAYLAGVLWLHPVTHRPPHGWHLLGSGPSTEAPSWNLLSDAIRRLEATVPDVTARCPHTAEFLTWWLGSHPTRAYRLILATDATGPSGYVIWRWSSRADGRKDARIVDAGAPWDRPDVWRWLLGAVTAECQAGGGLQVGCLAGRRSPLALALRANRYLPRQTLPLWLSPGFGPADAGTHWHATLADSDIDTAAAV